MSYGSTQLEFATSYLKQHRNVRVVTLQLGTNDGFLLLASCASAPNPALCVQQGLPAVFQSVATNIGTILPSLRAVGYGGPILLVNYYSTVSAFAHATSGPALGGKTCRAGLLDVNPLDTSSCDVHPAQSGHQLIAEGGQRTRDRRAIRSDATKRLHLIGALSWPRKAAWAGPRPTQAAIRTHLARWRSIDS